jgi:hypothetical protein
MAGELPRTYSHSAGQFATFNTEAEVSKRGGFACAAVAACGVILVVTVAALAQTDNGPTTEKAQGQGLPRDRETLIFTDDQYPVWPAYSSRRMAASSSASLIVPGL